MKLVSISINHRTAPLELREALYLNNDEVRSYIKENKDKIFKEGLVISTCNRTEIYGIPSTGNLDSTAIQSSLLTHKKNDKATPENFQSFVSRESIEHLFRVSSGIDSLLIGDNQIFKQVKDSFTVAEEMEFCGALMRRIMDAATKVGKRAISETAISEGAVTVSYAAVQLIEKIFSNLSKKSALVIGTGETGEIAARHLRDRGIGSLTLSNRTFEKAETLARKLDAAVFPFESVTESLNEFDIVISATSSPEILITKKDVHSAMKKRNFASLVLMDIAVPRDIDPSTKSIDYVFYHDIDSLNIIVEQNLSKRKNEIPKVEKIIKEELDSFFEWYESLQAAPTIKSLREYFETVRAEEVGKNINKFNSDDRDKVDILTKRILNKILHHPTVELKKTDSSDTETATKMSLIRELFGLDNNKENKTDKN